MSTLFDHYRTEFISLGGIKDDILSYTTSSLANKIRNHFHDDICIELLNIREGNLVFNSSMKFEDAKAALCGDPEKTRENDLIRSAALHLRSIILTMPKTSSPVKTTAHSLKATSADIPEQLNMFFTTLFQGLKPKLDNDSVERKTVAIASDAIFNTTKGSVIPWKQTNLGLGLSSLSGSKLIIQILNRLGHSISYDRVKEIETEFAYSCSSSDRFSPDGLLLESGLATASAWDNYDVNIETTDGKDTLHCTVGICYQNAANAVVVDSNDMETCKNRKRKSFQDEQREIPQYCPAIKRAKFDMSNPDSNEFHNKERCLIDFWWLLRSQQTHLPLFPGYIGKFIKDELPQQTITYLEPLMSSPTLNKVVRETMIRTLKVAEEMSEDHAIVTYDLAIASKAYCIQQLEAPKFDNLHVLLGNFHIELAFFGALGTFVQDSGAEIILINSSVLSDGSVNGFIKGKFYNRCARIHQILATVFERIMYREFLKSLSSDDREAISIFMKQAPIDDDCLEDYLNECDEFQCLLLKYEHYFDQVMNGFMGPTAAYWATYVYLVNRVYRNLQRSVRMNDLNLYIETFPIILDMFFALNRPNYARWGSLYLDKLRNLPTSCRETLQNGAFSIRRTSKNFSRSSVDLALEQTINRDAASTMRGIVSFRNSGTAIKRWALTAAQRGMIVSSLKTFTGLESVEQPASQARNWRIQKDNKDIDSLNETIQSSCNPFDASVEQKDLVNIATGKVATQNTKTYLLEALDRGKGKRITFQAECSSNPKRFLEPIKRTKIQNFAVESKMRSQSAASKSRFVAESVRDVFGRVMLLTAEKLPDFDLKKLLSHPITEVPLSLAHSDGTMIKTDKSALLKFLEKKQTGSITSEEISDVEFCLIDGGQLLHTTLQFVSGSYGAMARQILSRVCSSVGRQIHVLFDVYKNDSLKESERILRGNDCSATNYFISGPDQKPRQSGQQLAKNCSFKNEFAKFLQSEWQKEQYASMIGSKVIVVSHGGNCVDISSSSSPSHLQATHEEADTLIAYHANAIMNNQCSNMILRASDTDILIILLSLLERRVANGENISNMIVMDCGTGNHRRFIDVNSIFEEIKQVPHLATALLGLHAFTGCDINSAFYRKGKLKQIDLLLGNSDFTEAFARLSDPGVQPDMEIFSAFVCYMYGHKDVSDTNEARFLAFKRMSGKGTENSPLKNIKKIDCSLLPPCQSTLKMQVLRSQYAASIWGRSEQGDPAAELDPIRFGWKRNGDDQLVPEWYTGCSVPTSILQETALEDEISDLEDEEWSDSSDEDNVE